MNDFYTNYPLNNWALVSKGVRGKIKRKRQGENHGMSTLPKRKGSQEWQRFPPRWQSDPKLFM
jgi:hypothetical protein